MQRPNNWSYRPLSLVNETEDSVSPYLLELAKEPIAIEWTTKQAQASSDDIGTYRALLARVIELHQEEITSELSPEEASFGVWRYGSCARN